MTTYAEVAQALVAAGYLTEADLDAAAVVLANTLLVEEAQREEADALEDEAAQQELIAGLTIEASTDGAIGDYVGQRVAQDRIVKARAEQDQNEAILENAEATIAFAYHDAAAALLAAELIDEGDLVDVAAAIAGVWIVED
jgi:membrane-bound lytic murein transglycosylase B